MKRYFLRIFFLLFLSFSSYGIAASSVLTHITISTHTASLRLEFSVTGSLSYKVFTLSKPDRLVIDFPNTHLSASLPNVKSPLLSRLRVGHPVPTTVRLVFDLNTPVRIKTMKASQKIRVDVYGRNAALSMPVNNTNPIKIQTSSSQHKTYVIVIDPGHGGKDPGAIGEKGTREKDVVLAISRHLANLINQEPHLRAELTRSGDYFIPLRQRLRLARKGKADMFVAIHADSFFNGRGEGASVYALSHRGATSEAARWLAQRENTSELGGVDLQGLEDKSVVLRSVLIDLAQTATITDSLRLGNALLDSLDAVTKLHYTRVEQAPFVVLKSPDIPSVLVETGFLSNPQEERKLNDRVYQQKIAQALLNGIKSYLKKYPMA